LKSPDRIVIVESPKKSKSTDGAKKPLKDRKKRHSSVVVESHEVKPQSTFAGSSPFSWDI